MSYLQRRIIPSPCEKSLLILDDSLLTAISKKKNIITLIRNFENILKRLKVKKENKPGKSKKHFKKYQVSKTVHYIGSDSDILNCRTLIQNNFYV